MSAIVIPTVVATLNATNERCLSVICVKVMDQTRYPGTTTGGLGFGFRPGSDRRRYSGYRMHLRR
jgi:hypothetical protein